MQQRQRTRDEQREADRAKAKRAALKALRKAKLAADRSGVKLSDWEGEFLQSVETRVDKYGRAFRDPEKGGPHSSLSMLQHVKLKEIGAKAHGKKPLKRKSGFGQRRGGEV
ncbi:MAG TPA: hypothetical protein VGG48_15495 [Rhizomicrobium sp.]|jgi:hypothetical protein